MIAFLMSSRIGRWLSALGAALAILAGAFAYGRQTQKHVQKVRDLEDYKETRETIDEVDASPDRAAAVKRLRDNGVIR